MKRGNSKGPKKVQDGLSENVISWGFKKSFPLFLMDNIKLEEIPSKTKRTIVLLTALYHISNFAGLLIKSHTIQLPVLLFLDVLHQQRTSFTIIRKKIYDISFPFLMDSTQPSDPPHPVNSQNT